MFARAYQSAAPLVLARGGKSAAPLLLGYPPRTAVPRAAGLLLRQVKPRLELKTAPAHCRHAFLESNTTVPC